MPQEIAGAGGGATAAASASRVQQATTMRAPTVDSATLTADDDGQLTLSPRGKQNIDIGKGTDGRYHVGVGGQDIAFTPEQMSRLNIQAGQNQVKMSSNLDIPVNVNGHPCVPGKSGAPEEVKTPGYDAAGHGADRYERARSGNHADVSSPQQVSQADASSAHNAVKGHNWDSVGVPGQDKAHHADGPEKARKNPEEEEKKKKGAGKKFSVEHVFDPSSDKVDIKDTGEATVMEIHESLNLWKKLMSNMRGGDGLDASPGNAAEAEIAGARLANGMEQMRDDAAQRPTEVSGSTGSDNRGTPG